MEHRPDYVMQLSFLTHTVTLNPIPEIFKTMFDIIKSVVSIQTIMLIRLIGGLYYKISANKAVTIAVKVYCVVIAILTYLIVGEVIPIVNTSSKIRLVLQISMYTTTFVINFIYSGENFLDFIKNIRNIDVGQGTTSCDEIPISRKIFIVLMSLRILTHMIYTINQTFDSLVFTLSTLILIFDLIMEISHFTRIMMFESMCHRMTILRQNFERQLSIARRFDDEEIMKENLRKCMITYKKLLDTVRVVDAPMKPLIFHAGAIVIPKILNVIYAYLGEDGFYVQNSGITTVETVCESLLPFLPAVIAELVNKEIDQIKLCVLKQLLVCRGVTGRDAVLDAMTYFEQRPFKYTIWRLFTVDGTMILSFISLIITYTVVMVQFAHFYD